MQLTYKQGEECQSTTGNLGGVENLKPNKQLNNGRYLIEHHPEGEKHDVAGSYVNIG